MELKFDARPRALSLLSLSLVLALPALAAAAQVSRRVSPSWGKSLGAFFHSPSARRSGLHPLLSVLKEVDVASARERGALAPIVAELAKSGYTAKEFAALYRSSDPAPLRALMGGGAMRSALEKARAEASQRRSASRAAKVEAALAAARERLSGLSAAGPEGVSRLSTEDLIGFARSDQFRAWAALEKSAGRELFVLTDLDKTMAAGDIFTFYFKWRSDNGRFSRKQGQNLRSFLLIHKKVLSAEESSRIESNNPSQNAELILDLWRAGKLSLLDVWNDAYWPSLEGLPKRERRREAAEFARAYASKIYPGVLRTNRALAAAGVHVVIVSNGDQVLAEAVAPMVGANARNVVGAGTVYGKNGIATGRKRTYEDETDGPQPGKKKAFRLYLIRNKWRGWNLVSEKNRVDWRKVVVVGTMGDSAGPDGGMALHGKRSAIGDFMIDTPGEPGRLQKFTALMRQWGGKFKYDFKRLFTLEREPSRSGATP